MEIGREVWAWKRVFKGRLSQVLTNESGFNLSPLQVCRWRQRILLVGWCGSGTCCVTCESEDSFKQ